MYCRCCDQRKIAIAIYSVLKMLLSEVDSNGHLKFRGFIWFRGILAGTPAKRGYTASCYKCSLIKFLLSKFIGSVTDGEFNTCRTIGLDGQPTSIFRFLQLAKQEVSGMKEEDLLKMLLTKKGMFICYLSALAPMA